MHYIEKIGVLLPPTIHSVRELYSHLLSLVTGHTTVVCGELLQERNDFFLPGLVEVGIATRNKICQKHKSGRWMCSLLVSKYVHIVPQNQSLIVAFSGDGAVDMERENGKMQLVELKAQLEASHRERHEEIMRIRLEVTPFPFLE